MRKLKLFFACLLMAVLSIGQMWASSPATITFSELGLSNGVQYKNAFAIDANVTITFGGGTNDGKYYTTGAGIRTYGGGYFTVAASNEGTIVEVACTWAGDSYKPSSDVANPTGYSTSTGKWTGSASSVTFSRPNGSGHWRLQGVTVTYTIPGGKDPAGLAYDVADQKQLVKLGEAFTAPTLSNDNNLTISYESDNTDVAEVANDGSITIKAAGKAVITASTEGDATHSDGSASYTICVTNHAGTEADPFDVADARNVIDAFETMNGVYVSGIVSAIAEAYSATYHNISFDISFDGTTTTPQFRAYHCKSFNGDNFTSADDVQLGATVTVYGNLTKYGSTYELGNGCYLIAYEAPEVPKTDISNTKATAYTVSEALTLAANDNNDISKNVYIKGVVYKVNSYDETKGTYNIYIREEGKTEEEGKFEFYKCAGLYDEVLSAVVPFNENDVMVGNEVVGYGMMTYYTDGNIWEFSAGNYLVELISPEVAVTSVAMTESTAEVEVGSTVTLHASVLPENATNKGINWTVESGSDKASVDAGVVTGIAAGEAVIRATSVADPTKYAECTVTVNAPAPDDRYKAEQTGFTAISGKLATVTEGSHQGKEYISYEAKKGAASTLPAINNNDEIRLYQNGGLLVIGAAKGCKIDQVFLTTGSSYNTTIGYSKTETAIAQTGDEVEASTEWHTATGQNADTIVIVCLGTDKYSRIDVAKLDVRYTGDPAAIHHYVLAGNYATVFNQADVFNHDGLIIYAAYDEQGEDVVDITDECSFSAPNMNQAGEQTVEITYNNAIVQSYTITINATETSKLKFYAPVAWENVYAFTWEGTNTGNHEMTAVEVGSRWFECDMEKGVPFLVYNGSWNGMNQTENIAALDGPKCYAWATLSDDGKYNTIETCEMSYYIAGENLPEVTWNEGEHKAMTNNAVEFENLAAGTYKFKVTNNTWAWNLGYANADQTNSNITLSNDYGNVQFTTNVAMNVTIAYNPATEKITVNGIVPPKPFVPNIKFGSAEGSTKINDLLIEGVDSYSNTWTITTVPNAGGKSFTQSGEYSQVGSGSKPAESITFSATLANSNEIAAISYIAIKLGGFNGTVGNVSVKVDGTESASGVLNGSNDVVVESTNSIMGREISIEISDIDKGVKCYGIEYAYQKYELAALKFFAPRDETNKWDHVYAYAYDPNNNYQAYVAWPGEEVTTKDAEWYVYNAPKGHNVIFHDNAGMQTNDIEDVQEAACYVPTAIDYSANPKKVTLAEQCTIDYYVAGDEGFTGNNWDPANATCKFDENNQVVFHDVPAGSYQFKITNGCWAWSLGGNEFLKNEEGCGSIAYTGDLGNTCFKIDEVQDVTITYYPATREICLGAVTVKTPGELTANNIDNLYVDELTYPSFWTNITDYNAEDVTLTFESGDECVAFVGNQIKGIAVGTAVVKIAIAETALFTGVENTFTVTVSAVPEPPTPVYETVRGSLTAGNYYTLCFNKTMTAIQGASLWSFAGKDANMAYIIEAEAPYAAGTPYLIYAESDKLEALTEEVANPVAGSNNGLYGTFSYMSSADLDGVGATHMLKNNEIRPLGANNHLDANRAYIILNEITDGTPAPGRRVRAIPMQQNTATGIDALNATEKPVKLMINGQIYILRGEKMYDATGRLVK